jgi:hypothetical protein
MRIGDYLESVNTTGRGGKLRKEIPFLTIRSREGTPKERSIVVCLAFFLDSEWALFVY